MSDTNIQILVA